MSRISMQKLTDFGRSYFIVRGFSEDAAQCIAEAGVLVHAFGITTHGLSQWFYIRSGMDRKTIDPAAGVEVLRDQGAVLHLSGPRTPGQLLMARAVETIVPKAREYGIAMAAIKKTHWIGAVGTYLLPIAEKGLLAQVWAQNSSCGDCAPIGGIDATFSTNPLALAFPTGGLPMIADFSTAAVAMGRVNTLIREGKKSKSRIFMDADGNLTDDPAVVSAGGSIMFTGGPEYGHKGYALSLWCEALTALAGGDCNNPDLPQSQSFNLTVIDPAAFAGSEKYHAEMKRFVARVKGVRRLPGVEAVRLPGERGLNCLREARESGVDVDDATGEKLDAMAAEADLPSVTRSAGGVA